MENWSKCEIFWSKILSNKNFFRPVESIQNISFCWTDKLSVSTFKNQISKTVEIRNLYEEFFDEMSKPR